MLIRKDLTESYFNIVIFNIIKIL